MRRDSEFFEGIFDRHDDEEVSATGTPLDVSESRAHSGLVISLRIKIIQSVSLDFLYHRYRESDIFIESRYHRFHKSELLRVF